MLSRKLRAALSSFVLLGVALAVLSLRTHAANLTPPAVIPVNDELLRDELTLQQKRVWRALQKQDATAFKELVPSDFVGINRNGVRYGRDDGLQFIANCKVTRFDLADIALQEINSGAALLTYRVKYQIASNSGDEVIDLSMRNVAVFARRDNKWFCVFGQETPAAE